jgi:transposase
MKRFVAGADRGQSTLLPECLDDFIDEGNAVRAIDTFVDALDLAELGFDGVEPAATGRPSYHPSVLLKLYIYGYLNRIQSSRRLEREAGRNLEVIWLLQRLSPDATKRLPTSARTTALPSRRRALALSICVVRWVS